MDKAIAKNAKEILNTPAKYTPVAITSSDRGVIDADYSDERTLILFTDGGSGATVTIKHGNGYAGNADEVFKMNASETWAVTLDTAIYKNMEGADRGKIIVTADNNISIAVLETI